MKIAFTVDDLSPLYNFEYLDLLHDTFGIKFDAFIPVNHFGKALLSDNKEWVKELKARPFIEVNIHGIQHKSPEGESREYLIHRYDDFVTSLKECIREFNAVGITEVCGVKAPGWDVNNEEEYLKAAKDCGLKFVGLHYIGGPKPTIKNGIATFGYSYCAHEEHPIEDDTTVHSHIDPSQGDNGLCESLFLKLVGDLNGKELEPVFLTECL